MDSSRNKLDTPLFITNFLVKNILLLLLMLGGIPFLNAQEVGNLTVVKEANPEDNTIFTFTGTGPGFSDQTPVLAQVWSLSNSIFTGIGRDASHNFYVSDNKNRINKFNKDGTFLLAWGWGVATGTSQLETCTSNCMDGIAGSGNGQLDAPREIAVDASGSIYVVDSMNARIQKFDANGNFILQWGGAGTTEGLFDGIKGIAVDQSGNVYVPEAGNYRLQKFDSNGNFLKMWGWGVTDGSTNFQICTSGCQVGLSGSGIGQFTLSQSIGISNEGLVFVGDETNDMVQVFDTDGNYIRSWASPNPKMISIDNQGNPFVGSILGPQKGIRKYDVFGIEQTSLKPTDLKALNDFTIDDEGNWYVVGEEFDFNNARISKYVPRLFMLQDPSSNSIQFTDLDIGTYYIKEILPADWELSNISCTGGTFTIEDSSVAVQITDGANMTCTFTSNLPLGNITIVKEAAPAYDTPFEFNISGRGLNVDTLLFEQTWGAFGATPGLFNLPYGIVVDASNNVYVTDGNNHRIQKFDSEGNFLLEWGVSGINEGQFDSPLYGAVDVSGNIWITDSSNDRVQQFDANGNFLKMIGWGVATGTAQFEICTTGCRKGIVGEGDGQFNSPSGIDIDDNGIIFITEIDGGNRIQKFDSNGNYLSSIQPPYYSDYYGLTLDTEGNIYVVDLEFDLILKYANDGTFLLAFGLPIIDTGTNLDEPYDITIDKKGNLYIAGGVTNKIQKFDSNGNFLTQWGSAGTNNGQLNSPTGLAFDNDENLYVVDHSNHRIQKFSASDCAFTLMDPSATTKTLTDLRAGKYTIRELLPNNWEVSNITCTGGNPQIGDTSVTITLTDGADIICTFSNDCNTDCEDSAGPCIIDNFTFDENDIAEGIFHAIATITSTRTVENNTTVVFKAGTSITLEAGFHAVNGSNFTAMIEACPATLVVSEARSRQTTPDKVVQVLPSVKVFPNPVHSYTNISVNLPKEQEVQLAIYDLNGRRITTILPNTFLSTGIHLFEWSCNQVTAGIYFVGMNGQQVGRLVVIK